MGGGADAECELCGDLLDVGNDSGMCEFCQDTLDKCDDGLDDDDLSDTDDEEFLRGPTF
jgi:hypothetical protein